MLMNSRDMHWDAPPVGAFISKLMTRLNVYLVTPSMNCTKRNVDTPGNAAASRGITSVSLGVNSIDNNRTSALTSDILLNKSRYPNSWLVLTLAKMRWVALETRLEMHLNSP